MSSTPTQSGNPSSLELDPIVELTMRGAIGSLKRKIAEGLSPSYVDRDNKSLLHYAAINHHRELVEYLLEKGADANLQDNGGQTVLHWVASTGSVPLAHILIQSGADFEKIDGLGYTPLIVAIQQGHTMLIQYLLHLNASERPDNFGHTTLHWAAYRGHCELVEFFVKERGIPPDVRDNEGMTPLHWACVSGQDPCVRRLLKYGADTQAQDKEGKTPLKYAQEKQHPKCADTLQKRFTLKRAARLVFGPSLGRLPKAIFIIMTTWIGLYGLQHYRPTTAHHTVFWGVYYVLFPVMYVTYFYACQSDPGRIPAEPPNEQYFRDLTSGSGYKLCSSCHIRRPVRSKHCPKCNMCIARFDHHCLYTNNCVGHNNHRGFYLFVTLFVWGVFWQLIASGLFLHHEAAAPAGWALHRMVPYLITQHPWQLLILLWCAYFAVTNVFLWISQTMLIMRNMTTNEMINGTRYAYLWDPAHERFCNPFYRGKLNNALEFFRVGTGHMDYYTCMVPPPVRMHDQPELLSMPAPHTVSRV